MRYGVVVPTQGDYARPGAFRDLVQAAEDLGFETAWFGDHVVVPDYAAGLSFPDWFESVACCGVGLGATTRLRFGIEALVLPYRHPLVVAKQAATIDQLSGGRLTLVVGIGFLRGEFDALGAPPFGERATVTEEYIAVLRQAWETPGPVSFHGSYVRFSDVHARPGPAQRPSLPLWVGGNHPRALRRAGELGDGWHPLWPALADYRRQRGLIEGLREAARRDGPFTFSYSCPEMRITDRPASAKPYSHADVQGATDFGYVPPLPTADGGRTMFSGTVEQVAADVSAAAAAGVDQLSVRFWAGSPDVPVDGFVAQMELFMRQVAPAAATR